ncbi:MAG: hypothetical protein ACO3JL_10540 [Myxococcota bacterium]
MKRVPSSDRKVFLDALALWDRPEEQLYGKVLERDLDTDAFVERLFSNPRAGLLDS